MGAELSFDQGYQGAWFLHEYSPSNSSPVPFPLLAGKSVETPESVNQGALPPLPRQSMLFKVADLNHHVLNEIQGYCSREES